MLDAVRHRLQLLRCAHVGQRVRLLGQVWIHGGGVVELGDDVVLDGRAGPVELRSGPNAKLVIGDGCSVMGGVAIEAEGSITLGQRVRVAAWAKIIDTHFHRLTGNRLEQPKPGVVVIEDECVLEPYSIVLPGAHLERGVTVTERAVVSRRVPARHRARGNPARVEPLAAPPAAAST